MAFFRFAVLLLTVSLLAGCDKRPAAIPVTPPKTAPAEEAKAGLKHAAETGQIGSELMMIRENLEKLKSTDAAKGEALLKDLDDLSKASQPDAVKAKAKAMIDKL